MVYFLQDVHYLKLKLFQKSKHLQILYILIIHKFHNFDQEFDHMLKDYIDINDVGFDLGFLPFIIQANIEKFANTQHPMYDLKYNNTLEKIGQKLNDHQKRQVLMWSMILHAIKCLNEFDLDKAPIRTQDLFYNNTRVENFFKEQGYNIGLNTTFFSDWHDRPRNLDWSHYRRLGS